MPVEHDDPFEYSEEENECIDQCMAECPHHDYYMCLEECEAFCADDDYEYDEEDEEFALLER